MRRATISLLCAFVRKGSCWKLHVCLVNADCFRNSGAAGRNCLCFAPCPHNTRRGYALNELLRGPWASHQRLHRIPDFASPCSEPGDPVRALKPLQDERLSTAKGNNREIPFRNALLSKLNCLYRCAQGSLEHCNAACLQIQAVRCVRQMNLLRVPASNEPCLTAALHSPHSGGCFCSLLLQAAPGRQRKVTALQQHLGCFHSSLPAQQKRWGAPAPSLSHWKTILSAEPFQVYTGGRKEALQHWGIWPITFVSML